MPDATATATLVPMSFRAIFEEHARGVFRFHRRLLDAHGAAEDATQETFVRLHRALATFDGARPLRPYLFTIARNVAIDAVRERQKRPKPSELSPDAAV